LSAAAAAALAVHADWSMHPGKRWMTVARPETGAWQVAAPEPVGDVATLLRRLRQRARGAAVALGVDLPLGLPRHFAARHAAGENFPAFLRSLADRPDFLHVCSELHEISAARPFYPRHGRAGMTRAAHAAALGLAGPADLLRTCDRATATRPAGAPLFWTLGANQSGKAAISAWRDLLLPALHGADPPVLWPFTGGLRGLLTPGAVAIAETYPAEAMRHFGLHMGGSKRRRDDRMRLGAGLHAAMEGLAMRPAPALRAAIADGFGADADGEDRFDSLVGLLCVVNVLAGHRPDTAPGDPWIVQWEGWVLGQTA
jgi:hypothetical protein